MALFPEDRCGPVGDLSFSTDFLRRTADEGAVATSVSRFATIVDDGIGDEGIRSGGAYDVNVTLRDSRSRLGEDAVNLLPSLGVERDSLDCIDLEAGIAVK